MDIEKLKERKCKLSDYNFVYNLTRRCLFKYIDKYSKWNKSFFDKKFATRYKNVIILMIGKKRVGYYELKEEKDFLYVCDILLTESYRNKGIGSYLLKKFENTTKRKIRLEYYRGNPASRFYRRLGYKKINTKNNKIIMEKQL